MSLLNYLKNKTTQYILTAGLAASVLTGCKETRTELSNVLHEDAKVVQMEHENHWLQALPMQVGKTTIIHWISHPERNIISFDGGIDFEINNKNIYSRFKEGDIANVLYRESYKLTFEDLDRDGKKEQTEKTLIGYEFVDAWPKNK